MPPGPRHDRIALPNGFRSGFVRPDRFARMWAKSTLLQPVAVGEKVAIKPPACPRTNPQPAAGDSHPPAAQLVLAGTPLASTNLTTYWRERLGKSARGCHRLKSTLVAVACGWSSRRRARRLHRQLLQHGRLRWLVGAPTSRSRCHRPPPFPCKKTSYADLLEEHGLNAAQIDCSASTGGVPELVDALAPSCPSAPTSISQRHSQRISPRAAAARPSYDSRAAVLTQHARGRLPHSGGCAGGADR